MRAISLLDEAMTIINGEASAAAKSRRLRPLTAVVLDAGGRLKAALKQDGCAMLRFEVAYGKAHAALSMGAGRRGLCCKSSARNRSSWTIFWNLPTARCFLKPAASSSGTCAGEVIGAIGVTGDAGEMDDVCAIAGIHAAGHKTCSDFTDPEVIRAINVKAKLYHNR